MSDVTLNRGVGHTPYRIGSGRFRLIIAVLMAGVGLSMVKALDDGGVAYMHASIGKRVMSEGLEYVRRTESYPDDYVIDCPRPGGLLPDAWCMFAGYEVEDGCAADYLRSAYPDFTNYGRCHYEVIVASNRLPGCRRDLKLKLYANCLETI